MSGSTGRTSAAEVVLRDRERARRQTARKGVPAKATEPVLEKVSVPSLGAADGVDEGELSRRHRSIQEQLSRKQEEIERTGRELSRVRTELAELEAPIKADIMKLREQLESENRVEKTLVDSVNSLRKDLFAKEKKLGTVREKKQKLSDDLIQVMADYERRKSERLEQIAHLVGATHQDEANGGSSNKAKKTTKSTFQGF